MDPSGIASGHIEPLVIIASEKPLEQHATREPPVFIVGAPRSGTTLLQYMLRSHPRISLPTGESHFIVPLCANAATFGDLSQMANVRRVLEEMYRRNADFLDTDLHGVRFDIETLAAQFCEEGRNTLPAIVAGLFEKNAIGEGKRRWGDKTPYYALHLPRIVEWFPGAQVIHLIRDGRDCALSLMTRRHDFGVYNSYHAAKYWQHFVDGGQTRGRTLGPDQYIEIRYEDLVAEPRKTMLQICAFLREEYAESLVDFGKAQQAGKTPLLQKPVQPDNAGKWRSRMSRRQVAVFESAAGGTLARLGYPLNTSAQQLPLHIRAAFRAHNRLSAAVHRRMRMLSRRRR